MTPYRPTVLLHQRPHPSPAEILYHVISPYDATGKRRPLSHHTPRNLPWFSSFTKRLVPPLWLFIFTLQIPVVPILILVCISYPWSYSGLSASGSSQTFLTLLSELSAPRLYLTLISVRHLHRIVCFVLPTTTRNRVEPPGVHRSPEGFPLLLHTL